MANHWNENSVLEWLNAHKTQATLDGMARYSIPSHNALGVSMSNVQKLGKLVGKDHALAQKLWNTEIYEAQSLCAFVGDPSKLSASEMDKWCKDFDNWAICDTLCFHLFNRSPHAKLKIQKWSTRKNEFEKRAAFALLACIPGPNLECDEEFFLEGLELIEREAHDDRNFVKKGILWALRRIEHRKSAALKKAARLTAKKLSVREEPSARWIGRTALREFEKTEKVRATKVQAASASRKT